jgi:hypothetical protein
MPTQPPADVPQYPRVLVVTDSDSYVKWGASLAGQMPDEWAVDLAVVRSNAEPSAEQLLAALEGTRFAPGTVLSVGERELREVLQDSEPDVLVAASRGPTVQALMTMVHNVPRRPVIVTGLAGISIPVLPLGLGFRRAADVFIVQSHREMREFADLSEQMKVQHRFELATMPLLQDPPEVTNPDRIVFAAQSLVPSGRDARVAVLNGLADAALAYPELKVVLKIRSFPGEAETHTDRYPYPVLLEEETRAGLTFPPNLVVEGGSMREQVERSVAVVTVSSTAILEAIAADVPVLALTDFGVSGDAINTVFKGSGLFGSFRDVASGRFARPDATWARENYFHDRADNTWIQSVEELLAVRQREGLPRYRSATPSPIGWLRRYVYRRTVFVSRNGETATQRAFLALGRAIVRSPQVARSVSRRLGM